MINQINRYQQKLFNKLFVTLPGVWKLNDVENNLNLNIEIKHFYASKTKNFWFTKGETNDKYIYMFGIKDKSLKSISIDDACLIIDFDKNIQFNDTCLGLFSISDSDISILLNYNILNKKYPYINISNFKKGNIKSFDNSLDLETIDLGNLDNDFIDNLEKLIIESSLVKSLDDVDLKGNDDQSSLVKLRGAELLKMDKDPYACKICFKHKTNFKIDNRLKKLEDLKPKFCGKCIEKIFASEFYDKLIPLLNRNDTEELKIAKEKFGNDLVFDIGISLLEKYHIIQYVGVNELVYNIDKNSYLIKKYIKFSDKNNLLIDNIGQIKESKLEDKHDDELMENNLEFSDNDTKEQMEIVIDAIRNGKSRNGAAKLANIPLYKIVHWYNEGKIHNKPENIYFFRKMNELETNNERIKRDMDKVLIELKNGRSISQIDFVSEDTINEWIHKGKQNKKPYVDFYNDYLRFKHSDVVIPKVVKIDSFGNKNTINKMNIILENLAKGMSENDVILAANVSEDTYNYWLNRGKQKFGELYIQFYKYVVQINHEICNDDDLWEDAIEFNKIDPGIYAPLSDEFASNFNSTQTNRTGVAWVNYAAGNKWIYSRSVDGEHVSIKADNIYELYDKVKDSGLDWGVRDYDVARNFIDIPEDFVVPSSDVVEEEVDYVPVDIDPGIYAPLSDEFASNFNSAQTNRTGVAWVNYAAGNKWIYSRSVDGELVYIKADNIYELYDKVKDSGLDWGVRDYDVARNFIDIPKDYAVPKNVEGPVKISYDIMDPLPEKYLRFLNTNQNRTGFAWVNPMGKKWVYQRRVEGISIKFSDWDIHKLHEKVIKNNHIWGVIDYDKAKSIIDTNKLLSSVELKPQINDIKPVRSDNVMVNYIQMSLNGLDVIIKGNINNNELINTLSKLSLFEKDIKRIITNSFDNQIDIFIELEINKYLKNSFEEIIDELGWNINK